MQSSTDEEESKKSDELKTSPEEQEELASLMRANSEKMEQITNTLKKVNAYNQSLQMEMTRQVGSLYDIVFRKLELDLKARPDRDSKALSDASHEYSQASHPDIRIENHIKDFTSIHNIKAKLTISALNTVVNDLMNDTEKLLSQYMLLKKKVVKQDKYLRAGFDELEEYEKILMESKRHSTANSSTIN